MAIQDMTTLIGSVGFPIFMSLYLIYYMQSEQKSTRDALEALKRSIDLLCAKIGGTKNDD